MDWIGPVVFALAPTVVLGLVFWWVLRAVLRSDRTERETYARILNEERAKAGLAPKTPRD